MYIIIMYLTFFSGFVIYLSYCARKFFLEAKKNNAFVATDKFYGSLLLVTAFLYIAIITASSIEDFATIISSNKIPFVFLCLPVIISSYRTFLSEGLYAFNNSTIIGYNLKLDIKDLNIKQVKSTPFERVKVVATINNLQNKKQQKLILRLSKDNFNKLKLCIEN